MTRHTPTTSPHRPGPLVEGAATGPRDSAVKVAIGCDVPGLAAGRLIVGGDASPLLTDPVPGVGVRAAGDVAVGGGTPCVTGVFTGAVTSADGTDGRAVVASAPGAGVLLAAGPAGATVEVPDDGVSGGTSVFGLGVRRSGVRVGTVW
jgi:hypothetical protein